MQLRGFGILVIAILSICMVSLWFLFGCGLGGQGSDRTGKLVVALTDAPDSPYSNVYITVKEIRAVPAGQENSNTSSLPVIITFDPPKKYDILALRYVQEVLGSAILPAGQYAQIRLVLQKNSAEPPYANYVMLPSDPFPYPLDTPSGQESGLKIAGLFEVKTGETTTIVLDFDPKRAIVQSGQSGKYLIKPTGIRIVKTRDVLPSFGSLSGEVQPEGAWSTAVVSAYPKDSSVAVASVQVSSEDGHFKLFLPDGCYYLKVTAKGYKTYDSSTLPDGFWWVTAGQDTSLTDPIVLSPD